MSKTLYIIRGLPGSGKSTLAIDLADEQDIYSPDDYFTDGNKYHFDIEKINLALDDCYDRVDKALSEGTEYVAVTHTFIKYDNYKSYVRLAREHGYRYLIIDLYNQHMSDDELADRTKDNGHDYPVGAIAKLRHNYQGTGKK